MTSLKKIQDSRRLMGFATSFSPEVIVHETPPNRQLGERTANYIYEQLMHTKLFTDNPIQPIAFTVLTNGISDVDAIVQHTSKHFTNKATVDELLDIFHQEGTVDTIAKHARFPEKVLRMTLDTNINGPPDVQSIALGDDSNVLRTTKYYDELTSYYPTDLDRGCPVATPDSEQKLDPLFIAFSKWASELSIRCLYHARR